MQPPSWTEFLQCCICTNKFDSQALIPVSLSCGHTLCSKCLSKLKTQICPYDKNPIGSLVESLPKNYAILQLLESVPGVYEGRCSDLERTGISDSSHPHYFSAMEAIDKLAQFLLPLADQTSTNNTGSHLTKPMLRKLVSIVTSQILENEGRGRILRAARSIADRTVTELLVMHQNQQQLSTQLWTAVKNRGCQFLGPVMQEEALKLVLMVLQSGKFMARKTIVLYVVQKLRQDFPQASKTSVGHVVQLLYRASCFNVEKREDDSSLMQLKEEFRSYELLRREHDAQIIRMAMEAGLRISPEQWSSLLYGNHKHKSDMQSIIDKLISQGATSSGLSELIIAIGRSQDPYNLSEKIVPHLETLLKNDVTNNEKCTELANSWSEFSEYMHALHNALQGFSTFMQIQSGRFKTGLCPHIGRPEGCPRGEKCTYAHSEEEREHYRILSKGTKAPKARTEPVKMGGASSRVGQGSRGRHSGDLGPVIADTVSMYSYQIPVASRDDRYLRQGSGEGSFDTTDPYSYADGQLMLSSRLPPEPTPDPMMRVIQSAPPSKPAPQFYTPSQLSYTPSPAPQYHTLPVVSASHQGAWYDDTQRAVATGNQSYYGNQEQHAGEMGGPRPKRYSGDADYHSYINTPGSNPSSLTEQYKHEERRVDDLVSHNTHGNQTVYSDWSKFSQDRSYSGDQSKGYDADSESVSGIERSSSLSRVEGTSSSYPQTCQGYPSYVSRSSPSLNTSRESGNRPEESSPPVTATSYDDMASEKELELRMANLKVGTSHSEDISSSNHPLTTAVITSALSRTQGSLETVHEQTLDSDSHSTLSYSNSEFNYPPQTTVSQHYSTMSSPDMNTVLTQSVNPIPSVARGHPDLRERRLRLEEELQQVRLMEALEHQQQMPNRWSGPKTVYAGSQVGPRVAYEGGGGSPHHSGLIQQRHSYSGPVQYSHQAPIQQHQYSPRGTMQHQFLGPQLDYQHPAPGPSPAPQGGVYYTPQATPPPAQWSGPLSAPGGGYTLQQSGIVLQPSVAPGSLVVQPGRLEPPDDSMIAAYVQTLEQEKAASALSAASYGQHRYAAGPLPHGGVARYQHSTLAPRPQYQSAYKYTY